MRRSTDAHADAIAHPTAGNANRCRDRNASTDGDTHPDFGADRWTAHSNRDSTHAHANPSTHRADDCANANLARGFQTDRHDRGSY